MSVRTDYCTYYSETNCTSKNQLLLVLECSVIYLLAGCFHVKMCFNAKI